MNLYGIYYRQSGLTACAMYTAKDAQEAYNQFLAEHKDGEFLRMALVAGKFPKTNQVSKHPSRKRAY